ncbi:hypothetical protein B0H10DRAFT_1760816, partial [Mycena sp. CBHHK59/15]
LRQEFRELELLNEITNLKYECMLSANIKGGIRSELLRMYQLFRGKAYDPLDLHPALVWQAGDSARLQEPQIHASWALVGKDKITKKDTEPKAAPKRKAKDDVTDLPPKKRTPAAPVIVRPPGMLWNRINYSCAYDALFTPLYDIWQE